MKSKRGFLPRSIWNALIESIATHIITHVEGGTLRKVHGIGTTLIIDPSSGGAGGRDYYPSCLIPEKFIVPADLEEPVKVIFYPCEMRSCGIGDTSTMHPVNYGMETLRSDPPPEIELSDGENVVYVVWDTDEYGKVDVDSVELTLTEPSGQQVHIPPSPGGGGQSGSYSQEVGVINVPEPEVGDTVRKGYPSWIPLADHLSWDAFNRALESAGVEADGAEVAKAITETAIELRRIKAKEESVTGGKEFVLELEAEEKANNIELSGKVNITGASGKLQYITCDDITVDFATVEHGLITSIDAVVPVGECDTVLPGP